MDKAEFVYVSYIATTPELLWAALTGNEFWKQFSGPVEASWRTGTDIKFFLPDGKLYSEGVVLESNPPHTLSHTWPDPEGAQSTEQAARLNWKIERCDADTVKLTMVHSKLTEKAYQGVSKGWPVILNNLKQKLETANESEMDYPTYVPHSPTSK